MKTRFLIVFIIMFQSVALHAADYINILGVQKQIDTLEYRIAGPGITYTKFTLPEYPLSVYMLTVDLNNPYNFVETFQGQNQVGKTEAMTSAYTRLSSEHHRTIAGVNGNFWIVSGQGQPTELLGVPHSGSMLNGEMLTDPNGWNRGRSDIDIGFAMLDAAKKMWIDDIRFNAVAKIESVGEYAISEINRIRSGDELVLFNSYLGKNQPTRTDDSGVEVFVKPVTGQSWKVNQDVVCEVTRIIPDKGANLLESGESVLSGQGAARTFLENLSIGNRVTVNMGISTLTDDEQPLIEQMITGNALVMKSGELTGRNYNEEYNTMLYPRTGVGSSADGRTLYLITIDKGTASQGANTETMCGILKACGAAHATSMDGGGSAQMMLDGAIVNKPADGRERAVANGWFLFHNAPEDNAVTEIRFEDRKKEIPVFSAYKPVILGYNQYGVLVDADVENYTMTCSEHIGYIEADGSFVASGSATGVLTVQYNSAQVSKQVSIASGNISFRLDSVFIDGRREYPIEVLSTTSTDVLNIPSQLLTWIVDDEEICVVEDGILKGLKNGTTQIKGSLGTFEEKMKVRVEIPESGISVHDNLFTTNWVLSASAQLSASLSANNVPESWNCGIGVDFTYATGRAPFIKLTNQQAMYSLPDSVKITLNQGAISMDRAILSLCANNNTQTVTKEFSDFVTNTDVEFTFALSEFFDTDDIAIYPVWFDNINFYINAQTIKQAYTLAVKEIQLIYNGFSETGLPVVEPAGFYIYPNPVINSVLNLHLKKNNSQTVRTEIYNLSGQLLQSNLYGVYAGSMIRLPIKNLISGIYLLKVFEDEKSSTMKFVVK